MHFRPFLTTVILAAMLLLFMNPVYGEITGLSIEDTEVSSKTLAPGDNGQYRWTVGNEGNKTVQVMVDATVTGTGWSAAVEGKRQFGLRPGNRSEVEVIVSPLTEDADEEVRITVSFSVYSGEDSYDMVKIVTAEREKDLLIFGLFENPLPSPLDGPAGDFVISLVLWIILIIIVVLFIGMMVKRLTRRTRMKMDDIIIDSLRAPLVVILSLYGIISSLEFLPIPESALSWLDLAYGIVFTIMVMYVAIRILSALINAGIKVSNKLNEPSVSNMLLPMTRRIGSAVIFIVGLFTILHLVGLDITFFVTSMGVVGIIVAFAAQDTMSNVFAGLHLMLDQSFKIGDRILLPQKIGTLYSSWGDVLHIGLRSTKVRSTDGVILTVPNKLITDNSLANFSHIQEPSLRARIRFGVIPTWTNVKKAETLVADIANSHPDVQEKPRKPQVVLREFGDYDVIMELRFYVESPSKMRMTKSDLIHSILKRFEENNVLMSTPMTFNVESRIDPGHMGFPSLSEPFCSKEEAPAGSDGRSRASGRRSGASGGRRRRSSR